MQKNFWIVEDGDGLSQNIGCYALMFLPTGYCIRSVSSCKKFYPGPDDIVLLDQHGVDIDQFKDNGCIVITMSGDPELSVELRKPFKVKALKEMILFKINQRQMAKAS